MDSRRPRDPSVLDSVETALRTVARPGIHEATWNWRYEILLTAGPAGTAVVIGYTLGIGWLTGFAATALALLAVALLWPRTRRRLVAWAWRVITPHRVRTGCEHAWVQSRHGRLPVVLFCAGGIATPADAALCRLLGVDGIFVGSGIFKAEHPMKIARAVVEASLHFDDPEVLVRVSSGLGEPMKGIDLAGLPPEAFLQGRESTPLGAARRDASNA